MSRTMDSLVTEFILNDQYSTKTAQISGATASLTTHVQSAQAASKALGGSLKDSGKAASDSASSLDVWGSKLGKNIEMSDLAEGAVGALKQGFVALTVAVMGTEAAMATFFTKSYEKFAQMQTMELSFEGFLGSAEKAKQMMDYLQNFSKTSPFHLMDLTNTARELTQIGLSTNKFLPLIQMMGMGAFPKIDSGNLEEVMEILRRVKGGETGLALGPRGLGRFGIGPDVIQKYSPGLYTPATQPGEEGHFRGTADQALTIVAKIIQDRFSAAADKVAKGAEVGISDFHDAIDRLEISTGQALADTVSPIVSGLTTVANNFADGGVMASFVEQMTAALNIDPLLESEDGLTSVLIDVGATLIDLNAYIRNFLAGGKNIADGVFGGPALDWIKSKFMGGSGSDAPYIYGTSYGDNFRNEAEQRLAKLKSDQALAKKKGIVPTAPEMPGSGISPDLTGNMYLAQIAGNTNRSANSLEKTFKEMILGGGDLAREGVSPLQMQSRFGANKHLAAMPGVSNGTASKLMGTISDAISESVSHAMAEYQRTNAFAR